MTLKEQLLALQWVQLKHDQSYHKEIVILPLAQRMKHMSLHNAKYTAYFLEAIETKDEPKVTKTLVDAFIISLVSANILNQDLGCELGDIANTAISLQSLGAALTSELAQSDSDPLWFVKAFAICNGRLAKACESWDHLENLLFRQIMHSSNAAIFRLLLVEASVRKIDLAEGYKARIREVESRSIFDRHYREGAGGEV